MPGVSLFTWNGLVPERLSSRGLALLGSRWRGWGDGVHERVWARAEGLPLPRGWESPLWMGLRVWVCLSFPVSVPWPHRWPRVSGAAWRRLAERPQPAEQGDDLRSPSGGQGRAGAGPRTDSFRPVRLSKMPQTSGGVRGGDGQAVFMGGCPLGGLVLLGRGSGRNEAGMRASPAPRSSAEIPGAPCPVRGVCRRSSKCQQRRSDPQGREHRHQATQPVPKKLLHQHRTGA